MGTPLMAVFVFLFVVLQFSTPVSSRRKNPKYCHYSHHKMTCYGKVYPLKNIPRARPDTTSAEIRNINLGKLTRNMMTNLTYCNLTSLSLIQNHISGIADDAFQDLKYLLTFRLEEKQIVMSTVINLVNSVSKKIKKLYLKADDTDVEEMDAAIFQNLTELIQLHLNLRKLKVFNATALSLVPNLGHLNLSTNSLKQVIIERAIQNVTDLSLRGNNLDVIPQICKSDSMPLMPRLRDLDMGNNAIRNLNVTPLTCLNNLQKFTLSENRIEVLHDNAFANLRKLTGLYMTTLPLKRICDLAFNSSSLFKLHFTRMPILSTKRFNPAALFKHTPNLATLNMMSSKMDIGPNLLKQLLLNLLSIERLSLQDTYIKELPSGVFSKLRKLKKLVLSGNFISGWDSDVFKNVSSIRELVIDGCNIKLITEDSFPLEFRLNLKVINLANNPFICTCDLLWFRNWMKEVIANKSIRFTNYPFRYFCRSPNVVRLRVDEFNPTVESCTPVEWYVIFLPTFFSLLLVLAVSALVAYRYRWYVLYWISLLRRRRQRQQIPLREMKYDAFVSYSNHDDDWVYDELLHYLEGQLQLRLCEHSRDFKGGKLIVDNVFEALDTSSKTILVISNEYMKSDWCQFELQMALNSFYKQETDLVVVLLETIQARHVTSTLRALMTSTTYIQWSEDEEAQNLFRERLKNSLKK